MKFSPLLFLAVLGFCFQSLYAQTTILAVIPHSDPINVTLRILTSRDSLFAGDTILIEERIINTEGLVPSVWCNQILFQDVFDNARKPQWVPTITIPDSNNTTVLNFGSTGNICFRNGIDTVKLVLYAAPYTQDSLHQISTVLSSGSSNLRASTDPFVLLPGPLDSISIEDPNFIAIQGPVVLNYPGDMKFFYSNGYDHYQNWLGHINSNWTQSGSLHPIPAPKDSTFRIFYEAADANEQGFIYTKAQSELRPGALLFDSVGVVNNGDLAVIDSAVTKDLNGNGYLDHVFLYFSKPVAMDVGSVLPTITLRYATTIFPIDSIRCGSVDQKIFILFLRDSVRADNAVLTEIMPPPHSGWRPILTMNNLPGGIHVTNFKCRDGAGPVIWRVVVNRTDITDRKKDLVTVTFSEQFKSGKTNDFFGLNTAPPCSVFNVWTKRNGVFVKIDSVLSNINFSAEPDDSSLAFYMTNGKVLLSDDFFNIISDNVHCAISDRASLGQSNLSVAGNQKVKIIAPPIPPQPTKERSWCGTGAFLAFIPPLGFKVNAWRKRRKKPSVSQ